MNCIKIDSTFVFCLPFPKYQFDFWYQYINLKPNKWAFVWYQDYWNKLSISDLISVRIKTRALFDRVHLIMKSSV